MARNRRFQPSEEPFRDNVNLDIDHKNTQGPVSWLAPTQTTFSYCGSDEAGNRPQSYGALSQQQSEPARDGNHELHGGHRPSNVDYKWTSRNARKGRHTLVVGERSMAHDVDYDAPEATNRLVPTLKGLWRMVSRFPWDDLSYLTAISFVSGCTLLVVNAFLSILPQLDSSIQLSPTVVIAQSSLTFIGCSLFLTSSTLSYLEAVNVSNEGCFGWSAEQTAPASSGHNEDMGLGVTTRLVPDDSCSSHYDYHSSNSNPDKSSNTDDSGQAKDRTRTRMRMFPTLDELRTSYIYDLGFIACATLFASSIIYWFTSLASLIVTILGVETASWIRVLQLIAALGFAVASAIFALETQGNWMIPAVDCLGWHIGFWNFVGSCGFILFAAFTLATDTKAQSSSTVHYFWGE